jgi:DNA-binding PadR family transcriptional regulator
LGELIGGPHHGYLLREILGKIFGPFRQISWGALYPLIHRLEQQGLITPQASNLTSQGKSGQRNLYRITPAGRERFHALIVEAVPYSAYDPDYFIAKLGYFDHITLEHQVAIVQHHRGYLQAVVDYLQTNLQHVLANQDIPERERLRIQWVVEFRLCRVQAEMAWVDTVLDRLASDSG